MILFSVVAANLDSDGAKIFLIVVTLGFVVFFAGNIVRQTDRRTDRQKDRQTDRRQTNEETGIQTDFIDLWGIFALKYNPKLFSNYNFSHVCSFWVGSVNYDDTRMTFDLSRLVYNKVSLALVNQSRKQL